LSNDPALALRPAPGSLWRVGPPGVLFYLGTAAAILIALDASSRASLGMLLITAVGGLLSREFGLRGSSWELIDRVCECPPRTGRAGSSSLSSLRSSLR
jgi:hypothetical protein